VFTGTTVASKRVIGHGDAKLESEKIVLLSHTLSLEQSADIFDYERVPCTCSIFHLRRLILREQWTNSSFTRDVVHFHRFYRPAKRRFGSCDCKSQERYSEHPPLVWLCLVSKMT
jgi:hypothetical protein